MAALLPVRVLRYLTLAGLLLCAAPLRSQSVSANASITVTSRAVAVATGGEILGLSPNGAMQAVYIDRQLCAYSTATWKPVRCTKARGGNIDQGNVQWSPDSTRIAYTENWELYLFEPDIWVFDVTSGKQSDLTDDQVFGTVLSHSRNGGPINLDSTPTWSPSGDAIYFARTVSQDGHVTPSTAIYRIPAAGGTPQEVVNAAPDKALALWHGMAFAASGKRIVFTLDYSTFGGKGTGLYVSSLPSTHARNVLAGNSKVGPPFLLGLTPDGNTALIWYFGAEYGVKPPRGSFIFLHNLQTGVSQPILPQGVPAASIAVQNGAVLSPDGTKLLYVYRTVSQETRIVVRDVHTGAETTVSFPGEQAAKLIGSFGLGVGLSWAANDTVYIASQYYQGVLLTLHF